jgi:hypothetical protein
MLSLLAVSAAAFAQAPQRPPAVEAVRTATPPRIDGLLDDAVWEDALIIDDFTMQLPQEGVPASERTVVRILYDDDALYLGIRLYDSQPEKVRASALSRDSFETTNGEQIAWAIDSSDSGRDGFWFSTNPGGAQIDSQVFNEGQIFDREWDGIWESEARIDDQGWTVEVRLPFYNLRFQEGAENVMRINFFRAIRHKNEEDYAPFIPRNYQGSMSFSLGRPVIFRGIDRGRRLGIKPYGLVSVSNEPIEGDDTDTEVDVGMDVKWGITNNFTADFTVHPDFAQVEADTQQINFTRFPLFFPEKREFFLENAGLFSFGRQGQTQAFFSRRIGLDGSGNPVPILAGARLTGRTGPWSVGVLDVVTESEGDEPRTQFFVTRARRDIGKRSTVGAILTDREASDSSEGDNTLGGVDARLVFQEDHTVDAYLMTSDDPTLDREWAGRFDYRKDGDLWEWGTTVGLVDENFNPGIGFVRRTGIQHVDGSLSFQPRPKSIESVRQMFFSVSANYLEGRSSDPDIDGVRQDKGIHFTQRNQFESGDDFGFHEHWVTERINEDFEIADGVIIPPGDYDNDIFEFFFNTYSGRRVFGFGSINYGDFFDGNRTQVGGGFTTRFNEHLSVSTRYFYNRVRMPYGDFDTNLWITGVDYAFSPELFGGALIQWNDQSDTLDLNLRMDFIHTPGSDLFIVFNQEINTSKDDDERRTNRRGGIVKLTYLFQF